MELGDYLATVRPEHRRRVRAGPALPAGPDRCGARVRQARGRASWPPPVRRCSSSGRRRTIPATTRRSTWTTTSGRRSWPTSAASKRLVSDAGLRTALHPHWGLAIATGAGHRAAARRVRCRAVPRHGPHLPRRHRSRRHRRARRAGASSTSTSRTSIRPGAERVRSGEVPVPPVGHRRPVRAARARAPWTSPG